MIIGLSGYAGVGKDEAAKSLALRHGFKRVAFADALKRFVTEIDPTVEVYEEGATPEHTKLSELRNFVTEATVKEHTDYREILQVVGVTARKVFGEDIWVDAALPAIHYYLNNGNNVVITDVRFANEAKAIKTIGGDLVNVQRNGFGPKNGHVSEVEHEAFKFDKVILNDGSPSDLGKELTRFVQERSG